jgi:hypothetical protein
MRNGDFLDGVWPFRSKMNNCVKMRGNIISFMGTSVEGTSGPFREVFRRNGGSIRNSGVPPEETGTELSSAQHWSIIPVSQLYVAIITKAT